MFAKTILSAVALTFVLGAALVPSAKKLDNNNLLEWQTRKLNWSDFQGRPAYYSSNAALTSYQIGFTYDYKGGNEITFIVKCQFIKSESWAKRVAKTDYILNHEQKHFDLAEVYARKLRKKLSQADFRGMKLREIDRIIDRMYDDNWRALTKAQDDYDGDSEHGIDRTEQRRWDAIIKTELEKLDRYGSPRVKAAK
ncbi:MAG: hypothetical protein AAF502_20095 [Bacteroidota bacterium]